MLTVRTVKSWSRLAQWRINFEGVVEKGIQEIYLFKNQRLIPIDKPLLPMVRKHPVLDIRRPHGA